MERKESTHESRTRDSLRKLINQEITLYIGERTLANGTLQFGNYSEFMFQTAPVTLQESPRYDSNLGKNMGYYLVQPKKSSKPISVKIKRVQEVDVDRAEIYLALQEKKSSKLEKACHV